MTNGWKLIFQSSFHTYTHIHTHTHPSRSISAFVCSVEGLIITITFLRRKCSSELSSFVTYNDGQSRFGPPSMRRFQFCGIKTRRWMRWDGSLTSVFYVGRIGDVLRYSFPRVWLSISMKKVRHFRDMSCIDDPNSDTEKYSIVTGGTYISTGAINDRIKVAMSSLKWTPTLLTLIRAFINTPCVLFIKSKKLKRSWIIDYEIIRYATTSCLKRTFMYPALYNEKKIYFTV